MRTKAEKRREAVERMKRSKYADSKACRTGSKTEEQWRAWRDAEVERLVAMEPVRRYG